MFDGLKDRLDRLFREHARSDQRAYAAQLREALLEAKLGVSRMREALAASERELVSERKALEDAERRGRLAAQIPDAETATLAERWAVKHRERSQVLERKIVVQREELILVEREVEEMVIQYRRAGEESPADSVRAAWRDLEAAGGIRPEPDEQLRSDAERRLREEAIEAQLAYLKKKLGRDQAK
jgi:hypothetical protein